MAGRDQYMNFFTLQLTTGADASTLVEEDVNTGAGVATLLAWRIHMIEVLTNGSWSGAADGNGFELGVSTRKALSAVPELTDKGCILKTRHFATVFGAGTGSHASHWPMANHYLPPIIVASPNFSLYYKGNANFSGMQSKEVDVRIGFTTERLDDSAYREVFETWNYAN